jgi:hypothetical protein
VKRAGGVLLMLGVLALGAFGLLQLVESRDDSDVATPAAGIGSAAQTRCPTGDDLLTRDRIALADHERDYLLSLGNVVIQAPKPDAVVAIQRDVAGRYDPEFALAGQAVYLEPGERLRALAWDRELEPSGPEDPQLADFASTYLGRGARGSCD